MVVKRGKKPGAYLVTVWYYNPVLQEFAPEGIQVLRMENEDLIARPVRFAVSR